MAPRKPQAAPPSKAARAAGKLKDVIVPFASIGGKKLDCLPTGSLGLDFATGIGGWPRGRIVELFGDESSGKTTLALSTIARCQAAGGVAAFIDVEHAMDPSYAKGLGVNLDELLFSQPDSGEEALQQVEKLVDTGDVDIVVVDSAAALTPQCELDGEIGDVHVAAQARLVSQALRILKGKVNASHTLLLFTNQTRVKIGAQSRGGFTPKDTPGGKSIKFYASLRVETRIVQKVKKEGVDKPIGVRVSAEVKKNKCAPPFQEAEFDIRWGSGIYREMELLLLGVKNGLVQRSSGSVYSIGESSLGHGMEKAAEYLKTVPDMATGLESAIRSMIGGIPK